MIPGMNEATRALLATRFKRLHDEALAATDPPFSEPYRAMAAMIEVLILTGSRSVGRAIRDARQPGDDPIFAALDALFGDLWDDESTERNVA